LKELNCADRPTKEINLPYFKRQKNNPAIHSMVVEIAAIYFLFTAICFSVNSQINQSVRFFIHFTPDMAERNFFKT